MNKRPKIKLELTTKDKAIELLGWTSLLGIWALALTHYANLPDTIPIHFNVAGQADNFGRKSNILILSLIATILFIGFTIMNKFPHLFNYPTKITTENAWRQYTNATRMIRVIKMMIVVVFGLIIFQIIRIAKEEADGLGNWFLPLFLGLIFIPTAYFVVKSFKAAKP